MGVEETITKLQSHINFRDLKVEYIYLGRHNMILDADQ